MTQSPFKSDIWFHSHWNMPFGWLRESHVMGRLPATRAHDARLLNSESTEQMNSWIPVIWREVIFGLFWALRPWCCKQRMPFYCAQCGPRLMSFCLEETVALTMEFSEPEIVFPRIFIAFDLILSQLVFDTPFWRKYWCAVLLYSTYPGEPFWRSLCVALVAATEICLTERLWSRIPEWWHLLPQI